VKNCGRWNAVVDLAARFVHWTRTTLDAEEKSGGYFRSASFFPRDRYIDGILVLEDLGTRSNRTDVCNYIADFLFQWRCVCDGSSPFSGSQMQGVSRSPW
jgi:hypothetical protein